MNATKRKRQKLEPYDFFSIPLRDGSFGLGEFVKKDDLDSKLCVFYRQRESSVELLRNHLDHVTIADVIGLARVSTSEIERGEWVVVGNHSSSKRAYLRALKFVDDTMYTGGIPEEFMDAYHSLRSWNDYAMASEIFRAILMPNLNPPPQDNVPPPTHPSIDELPARENKGQTSAPNAPAQIHVTITFAKTGLPSVALVKKRETLERWIEAEGLGEVTDAGGGGGLMDIFADSPNARKAVAALLPKLEKMGWGECSTVEVEAEEGD